MNVDGHIGHSPSQSAKLSLSPDPRGKCRFSTNINIVCLCHGTTNVTVQLVNDLNMVGLLIIIGDSGADIC